MTGKRSIQTQGPQQETLLRSWSKQVPPSACAGVKFQWVAPNLGNHLEVSGQQAGEEG